MNDQTRISTLIDTVTELRAQLEAMNAKHASEARSAEWRYDKWRAEEKARSEAESKLAEALAESNRLLLECAALTTRNTDLYNRCCQLEQERNEMREAAAPAIGGVA